MTDLDAALAEAARVLRPGGRFACLEFAPLDPASPHGAAYDAYSFGVIPAMGALVAGDRASYQYLVESIRRFPPAPAFARRIAAAGFSAVHHEPLTLGVVQVHSAVKL